MDTGLINPEGIACDWINGLLYWTDSETKRIEVVSLKSRHRRVVIWEDLDLPRAIALAPQEGIMFWTDWGIIPKIERAGMDGRDRMVLVERDVEWPNGLTIDYDGKRLFWVEAKLQKIGYVGWDGTGKVILDMQMDPLAQPFAVTFYQQALYWTDWTDR